VHALGGGVVEAPRLAPTFIADEYHQHTHVLKLGQLLVPLLDVGYTTKSTEMMYCWLDSMSYLIRCAPFDAMSWTTVQDVDGSRHCLPPEPARDCYRLEHALSHAHDGLVSPLDDFVLL
jgi:hypothetical protein